MSTLPTVEKIIATQPKYKSPINYSDWLAHLNFCAKAMLHILKQIDTCEPETLKYETGQICYSVFYYAFSDFAPAYYLSKELVEALEQTVPILPADAPIALPSFHLMLPVGVLSKSPASITALCSRSANNKRFAVKSGAAPDALVLGINIRLDTALISFTLFCEPDFKDMYIHPNIEDFDFDSSKMEAKFYDSLRVKSAKLVVHVLLIMQYKPDLITTEAASHDRATGFGASKAKTSLNYFSTRWLGKFYKRKQSKAAPIGSHASPRAHWRKGHWHNFRHGPGRKELKLKWIEPIFVNP